MKLLKMLFTSLVAVSMSQAETITLQDGVDGYTGTQDLEQFNDEKSYDYSVWNSFDWKGGFSDPHFMTSSWTC
jgi:hypothetical protein